MSTDVLTDIVAKVLTNENIIQYCNRLYHSSSWIDMIETIKSQYFMVDCPSNFKNTPYENRIIKIKYLEHNKLWKYKWARECRGVILYLDDDNNIIPLKYQLQRGAEVLTNEHILKGIDETDDVKAKNYEMFDCHQRDVMIKLLKGENINGTLSFKCDGSLLAVTFYFGKYIELLDDIINNYTNDFTKIFYEMAKTNGHYCVPSSQGTFCLGDDMQSYNVSAILGNEYGPNVLDMISESNSDFKCAFKNYGMRWITKISKIIDYLKSMYLNAITITLNFESVCKNRLSAWETTPHTELAIKYNLSFTNFLGASICESNCIKFVPHFDIEILNEMDLYEPLYWKIQNASQVNEMLKDLESVINKDISEKEYLNKHKPVNIKKYNEFNCEFDFEGFVFLTPSVRTKRSNKPNEYNYNKIKTLTYYKCHNLKESNIDYLIEISKKCGDRFPLALKVSDFYLNLKEKLIKIINKLFDQLTRPTNSNLLFQGLPDKAKNSYIKQNTEKKIKILINVSDKFNQLSFEYFSEEFLDIKKYNGSKKMSDIYFLIKTIIMNLSIWNINSLEQNLTHMIENKNNNNNCIGSLLVLCIKSPIV